MTFSKGFAYTTQAVGLMLAAFAVSGCSSTGISSFSSYEETIDICETRATDTRCYAVSAADYVEERELYGEAQERMDEEW